MMDNLIFPIQFDLEKAVNDAGQQWDKKYAKKLEDYINKRPIKVKFDFENLTDVKTRLAQLKIEPITPETKTAIKELARELQVLAKALEQVQKYSGRSAGTAEVRGAKVSEIEAKASAARELARQRAAKAEQAELKLAAAREKSAAAANKATTAVNNLTKAYGNQIYYIERLLKKMVAVWSVQQVRNFLTNIREVTAQFELQRVSLGAIIQDQNKANQLFSEIKSFALKSPVSILDLTKYTKQLAAYKVGWDGVKTDTKELFEWTKKLTDVSVGLGVSMDRTVLAFGQVRATGYLRASEIRQFTEMGVPIVEELASKLSKMNGELVTAADVMDMVSKRGISFELVKEVFDDMTSAGGIFYNMQEKQGNTLFGLWAKLGDAASVMYEQIGNTESVRSGMETAISLLTDLMRNWKAVAKTVQWVIVPNAALFALYKYSTATQRVEAAQSAATAATERRKAAMLQLSAAIEKGSVDDINAANAALQKAKADEVAAQKATTRMGLLKSGFVSVAKSIGSVLGFGLVIGVVTKVTYKLFEAYENATRLKNTLSDIGKEADVEISRMVTNFESLAKKAVNAADGSREQEDALSELKRTYRDIIPEQNLTIEKLREMKGEYSNLTIAIREYIREQQLQKGENAIIEEYGNKIVEETKKLKKRLRATTFTLEDGSRIRLGNGQIDRIVDEYTRFVEKGESATEALKKAFELEDLGDIHPDFTLLAKDLGLIEDVADTFANQVARADGVIVNSKLVASGLTEQIIGQTKAIANLRKQIDRVVPGLGNFTNFLDEAEEKIKEHKFEAKSNTFAYDVENAKVQIEAYLEALQNAVNYSGINIDLSKYVTIGLNGIKHFDFKGFNEELNNIDSKYKPRLQELSKTIQNIYDGFVPKDAVVRSVRNKFEELANSMGLMDKVKGDLMGQTETLEDYRKKINDLAKDYAEQAENLTKVLAATPVFVSDYQEIANKLEDVTERGEFYSRMAEILGKSTSGSGSQSDPRLQNLKEEISLVQKLYNEYKQLEKQEGATKAAADMRRMAGGTLDMFKEKYNIDLPTDAKDLTAALEILYKKMAALPKKVFPSLDKDLKELRWTIEKVDIDESQKNIEAELKRLSDRISRTKTAKEFYEKILSQTGDIELATRVSLSIYGSTGEELFEDTVKQIQEIFKSNNPKVEIDLSGVIDMTNQRINYGELAKLYEQYQNVISESNRSTAENIIKEGQKTASSNIATWEKELAKAKDYEQQRTDIINRETQRRAEIYKSNLPQEDKDRLAAQSQEKQDEDLAKVNFEEFTKSEDYVRIFENLDNVATSSLKHLREELQKVIDTNKDLSPENMKTLVKAMEDLDDEIGERSPWDTMVGSVKDYIQAIKDAQIAKQELAAAEAQESQLTADVEAAKAEKETADADVVAAEQQLLDIQNQMAVLRAQEIVDETAIAALKTQEIAAENVFTSAKLRQNQAAATVAKAVQKQVNAQNKVNNAQKKLDKEQDNAKKSQNNFLKSVNNTKDAIDSVRTVMQSLEPILGSLTEEGSTFGDAWNAVINSMSTFMSIMEVVIVLQEVFNIASESNPWMAIAAAVLAVSAALAGFIGAQKVKAANKEIERQQELLDQLDYTYGRLEKAADKLFGADYIRNYNQQLKNLQAQQRAYQKQAEAERSKGKKADKEKIKEYEEQARDTADKIKELQDDLAAHFTGSSKTDVARQMAQSWIEARASMSDTFAAIKGDYAEMIKNMIVEGAAARVIENALSPMWDRMDEMLKSNNVEGAIDALVGGMDDALTQANNGMEVLWKALEARGYDMKQLIGDVDSEYTGIAKNISGATSEEINTAAAIGNTLMYYVSPIPRMDENLARVVALLEERGASAMPQITSAGWTDWQQQAMDNYNAIARNTADTVVECRRAAVACEAATEKLSRALRTKGATSGFNVFLNT